MELNDSYISCSNWGRSCRGATDKVEEEEEEWEEDLGQQADPHYNEFIEKLIKSGCIEMDI